MQCRGENGETIVGGKIGDEQACQPPCGIVIRAVGNNDPGDSFGGFSSKSWPRRRDADIVKLISVICMLDLPKGYHIGEG